jgi:sec-independent protein translocase protein TatB
VILRPGTVEGRAAALYLFILEGLGTTEMLAILVVALIVFGPRKLPELSRKLGKSLSEFRRASDDFKRTWEREVALDEVTPKTGETIPSIMPPTVAPSEFSIGRGQPNALPEATTEPVGSVDVTEILSPPSTAETIPAPVTESPASSKRDWL